MYSIGARLVSDPIVGILRTEDFKAALNPQAGRHAKPYPLSVEKAVPDSTGMTSTDPSRY
jgi:hypothetical protein